MLAFLLMPVLAQWYAYDTPHKASRLSPCEGIVDGRFVNESFFPLRCPVYRYSPPEAQRCLAKKTVLFVGDAFTRNLFRCFVDVISGGRSRTAYSKANDRLSCDNVDTSQHVDYEYHGGSGDEPAYDVYFYWNPLISYETKWCHLEICIVHNGVAPAGSVCECPPRSKLNVVYTGQRVRLPFMRHLVQTHRPDYVVTSPGVGDLNDEFRESLRLVRTLIVSYNPHHAVHWPSSLLNTGAKTLDFGRALDTHRRAHFAVGARGPPTAAIDGGHLDVVALRAVVHAVMSLVSLHVCPWARKFLTHVHEPTEAELKVLQASDSMTSSSTSSSSG